MSLTIFKDDNKNLMLLQNSWSSRLNPVLSNPLAQGVHLTNISLASGNNTINHKLGRNLVGYIITGMRDAARDIYQVTSQTPNLTLILHSTGTCTVDLYVF